MLRLALGSLAVRGRSASPRPGPFEEIAPGRSGLTWIHENARSFSRYLPETMGPGCAFLDYDNDGWMDIYLVNSGPADIFEPRKPLRNALYRNNRDGTFTDVTEQAGVAGGTFGMGVAVGDFDNDGWPDLFVTSYGDCILYRNNRNGTFTDVTESAGVKTPGWTTSAVWFDYDNDGKLDLFVCGFVDFTKPHRVRCVDGKNDFKYYCIPRVFPPTLSFLYHNNGDGTFTEVRDGTAIGRSPSKGLGVVAADINNDGLMDLFVANDTVQDFLFVNRGPRENGSPASWNFEEIAVTAGVAYSSDGVARSGMGVDAADVFGSGYQDLFVANVDKEEYSLYRNQKNESFRDVAAQNGVAAVTRNMSGWGLRFFDYDNDGALDLIVANGHPDDRIHDRNALVEYEEPLLLFHQSGGRLRNVTATAGSAFTTPRAARGLATGDFNNDGLVDVLITVNGGAPVLLKNQSAPENHWLGLKLEGVTCNRDAIGARVSWSAGGTVRSIRKNGGGSYLSSHDPRIVLGTGAVGKIDWVEIVWPKPSGRVQRIENPAMDRYMTVKEE
jgi:hypothetical protein